MTTRVGQTVSHYTILELIGSGGMGILYKAQDLRLDRLVVLKFLPPEYLRNIDARRRFMHEARAASAIDHPNICTIHDIDQTTHGHAYFVMDYYAGETLKQKIERGPLDLQEAIDYALQTARGLSAAHKRKITHRDIKPANMIVTEEGLVKILDFGIAKLKDLTDLTKDGMLPGTVAYMSPEQARSEHVDYRTDIWSLGVVFYEMLTGKRPFESEFEQALVYSIQNLEPEPPSVHRPELSPLVDHIAITSLAKDPEQRYQSAEEMVSDLEMAKVGETLPPDTEKRRVRRERLAREDRSWLRYVLSRPAVRVATLVGVAMILLILGILAGTREGLFQDAKPRRWSVAIREFQNLTGLPEGYAWAHQVRSNLLPTELTAVPYFDLLSTSPGSGRDADPDYVFEGSIYPEDTALVLMVNLVSMKEGTIDFAPKARFDQAEGLPKAAAQIVRWVEYYFDLEIINPNEKTDLDPWMPSRIRNIEARRAFREAAIVVYSGIVGSQSSHLEAIRLEPTFVAPRVWMIPGLLRRDSDEVAKKHVADLRSIEHEATAFERAMIEYAEMMISGNRRDQLQALDKALLYAPENRIVMTNRGSIRFRLGDYEGAAQDWCRVVESGMDFPPVYPSCAWALIKLGEWDEAREVLHQALELTHIDGGTYCFFAAFAMQDGDSARASQYELKAFESYEEDGDDREWEDIYADMGEYLLDMERPEIADRYLRLALAADTNSARLLVYRAEALCQQGDTTSALEKLNRALLSDSTYDRAYLKLGTILDARGKRVRAADHYRRFLTIDSVSVDAGKVKRKLSLLAAGIGNGVQRDSD